MTLEPRIVGLVLAPCQQKEGSASTHSGALVRERTIPTQLPPLVGEVSGNF
jgi:hypothetical protein